MDPLVLPLAGRDGERLAVGIWSEPHRGGRPGFRGGALVQRLPVPRAARPYRLVRMPEDEVRPANRGHGRLAFADGYPFMVISTASLADLNRRMPSRFP